MFAMSGDGSSNSINIPAVFLFFNEGQVLQKAIDIVRFNTKGNLRVRLGDKALKRGSLKYCYFVYWTKLFYQKNDK